MVNVKGEVVTSTGNLPVTNIKWNRLPNKPPPANDVSIGVNGAVWVALKGGGTALRKGTAWLMRGPQKLSTNVAVNQNGDPWVSTAQKEIWAFK